MNVKNWSKLVSNSVLGVALLSLASCDWGKDPLTIRTEEAPKPTLDINLPAPIETKKVEWYVVEVNNPELIAEFSKKNIDPILFGLTDDGYKNLALNLSAIRKHVVIQRKIINEYKKYYESNQ